MENIEIKDELKQTAIKNITRFFSQARMAGEEDQIEALLPRWGLPLYPEYAGNNIPRGCRP